MISKCCNAEIEKRHGKFSPDNSGFYIHTSYDCCSKCNEEWPEEVEQCSICGEGNDHLIDTILGDVCQTCCVAYADELVVKS